MCVGERERRTLELANRLPDMNHGEWQRVRSLIDRRFETMTRQMEREIKLSEIKDEDFVY